MRILLTGASGFIGGHVQEAARVQGHAVIPLRADLRSPEALKTELASRDPTHVLHLAGIAFVGNADVRAFYEVNLLGTLNLLEALASSSHRPLKVVLASSANVYGNAQVSPLRETQPPAPTNHYAMSKLAMEHLARTYETRLDLCLARTFNSTGPGQSEDFLIPKLVKAFKTRAPEVTLGNLEVEREFNDIRRTAAAFLGLVEHGISGETYNLCSGQPHRLKDVIDRLETLTGHRPKIRIDPDLVRPNEVLRLCGDPRKLLEVTGPLPSYSLDETLSWMLEAAEEPFA